MRATLGRNWLEGSGGHCTHPVLPRNRQCPIDLVGRVNPDSQAVVNYLDRLPKSLICVNFCMPTEEGIGPNDAFFTDFSVISYKIRADC